MRNQRTVRPFFFFPIAYGWKPHPHLPTEINYEKLETLLSSVGDTWKLMYASSCQPEFLRRLKVSTATLLTSTLYILPYKRELVG